MTHHISTNPEGVGVTVSTSWWPADTSEPVLETTVGGVLRTAAQRAPDHTALVGGIADPARRRWTYAALLADAERVARALLARVAQGERVAIWAANSPEWMLVEYGAALAGVVLVTVNPALTMPEARYVLAQSRVAYVLHDDEFRGQSLTAAVVAIVPELPDLRGTSTLTELFGTLDDVDQDVGLPEVSADDAAQIRYPSGTTGFPKGALLRHRSVTNVARLAFARGGVAPGAVYLTPLPLLHTAACSFGILGPVDPPTGDVVPIGQQGEMCVRGFSTMIGYFDMPDATAATLDADGWLHTGDLCTMDERGYVSVTGIVRTDPAAETPGVDELRTWCQHRLARHKIPTQWFVTDQFPLTGSGKIQKFVLRDWLANNILAPLTATRQER